MIPPPPCLTVCWTETSFNDFGSLDQNHVLPSELKRLIFVSSEKITLSQSSAVQSECDFANSKRALMFFVERRVSFSFRPISVLFFSMFLKLFLRWQWHQIFSWILLTTERLLHIFLLSFVSSKNFHLFLKEVLAFPLCHLTWSWNSLSALQLLFWEYWAELRCFVDSFLFQAMFLCSFCLVLWFYPWSAFQNDKSHAAREMKFLKCEFNLNRAYLSSEYCSIKTPVGVHEWR